MAASKDDMTERVEAQTEIDTLALAEARRKSRIAGKSPIIEGLWIILVVQEPFFQSYIFM